MADDNHDARIAVLETALADAISYLKRLPLVPATSATIAALEARLAERPAALQYAGARHSAAGLAVIEVAVTNNVAFVRTGSPADKADRLWELLADGIVVGLKPAAR